MGRCKSYSDILLTEVSFTRIVSIWKFSWRVDMDINGTKNALSPQLPKPELEIASDQTPATPNNVKSSDPQVSNGLSAKHENFNISHAVNTLKQITTELKASGQPVDQERIAQAKQALDDRTLAIFADPYEGASNIATKLMEELKGNEDKDER